MAIASIFLYSYLKTDHSQYLYKNLFDKKMYAVWLPHGQMHLSHKWQENFGLRATEDLETVVMHLDPDHYNALIDMINQIDLKNFHCHIRYKNRVFDIFGYKLDDYAVLECAEQTDTESEKQSLQEQLSELKKYSYMLETLLNASPVPLWYRDADHQIKFCNKAYAHMLGTDIDKILDEQIEMISTSHPQSPFILSHEASSQNKKQSARLYAILNGRRHFLELCELPLKGQRTAGYALDLSVVDDLEKKFDRFMLAYQGIFEQLSTPIVVFKEDTQLDFCNKAYTMLFEFDQAFLGRKPYLFDILDDLRKRQKIPEPSNFLEFKNQQKALFKNILEPLEETLHLPNGKILRSVTAPRPSGGIVVIYDDITDKTHLEQEYKTLTAVQQETINRLFEGIIVLGGDLRIRFSNTSIETILGVGKTNGLHLNDFIRKTATLSDTKWLHFFLGLFEKRMPLAKKVMFDDGKDILFTYSPLPDGSHLLSFIDLALKQAV